MPAGVTAARQTLTLVVEVRILGGQLGNERVEMIKWSETKAKLAQRRRERVFNKEAHAARVEIIGRDLGFKMTKDVLLFRQFIGVYPKP